ncbi:bacterioferritin [Salinispirillum sp. LH 10-3-1]|uniref:Bacterioferritin n=1 Tax=Salinispirillum sp. LH 10-3-1 TaxID=2952525 RepID=A0AB38YGE6_9GAMM
MKGNQAIIDSLNGLLAYELASIDQYFIHSQMYDNWGYQKLFERIDHERQDETGHATLLIARILFLEGTPNVVQRAPLRLGANVPDMLSADLQTEYDVAAALKTSIALCEQQQDYVTRDILLKLLDDTEQDHAHWLEQQLGLIKAMGLENYLQAQV